VADGRRAQAERAARDAGLPIAVQRFLGRAAEGAARRFTVTYRGPGDGRTVLVQRPPERRIDVVGGVTTSSLLRLRRGSFSCRQGTAGWECDRQAAGTSAAGPDPDLGVFSPAQINDTVVALAAARTGYRFEVKAQRLAGTTATCLVTTKADAAGPPDELCIADEGAVLRVRTSTRTLEATAYKADVDPAALRLPAQPR
jgi:hypothetical protein